MRITEKMGLVYTALFLTVSVAVITQNSDALMAAFKGDTNIRAVDDIFTVSAGRDQRLFVLQNDVNSGQITSERVKLVSQPACGTVNKTGGSFKYTGSAACSGNQKFSYCLEHGGSCDAARVTLRLVQMRVPVDSIANGPVTDLSGLETQVEINNSGLEIANVHLGQTAPSETTHAPAAGIKLAGLSPETAPVITLARPTTGSNSVSGVFSMTASDTFTKAGGSLKRVAEVSPVKKVSRDTSILQVESNVALPSDPLLKMTFGSAQNAQNLTNRMVKIDTGFIAPSVMPGIDDSPFGTPCVNNISTNAAPNGMVRLMIKASCLPNSRVEIRHSKMIFALNTSHSGAVDILVPALEENALFSIVLADGTIMKSTVLVPDLKLMERVAVQWRDGFDVNLTAREFGKHRTSGRLSRDNKSRAMIEQGYSIHLGDPSLENPIEVVVYNFGHKSLRSGVIELDVIARTTRGVCGGSRIIHSYRSRGGRLVGASGLQFKLPDCGANTQSIVLKNAVRDLIIAAN